MGYRTVVDRIRAELRHASELHAKWEHSAELVDQYAAAPEGSTERARIGGLIADLNESIAEHLEQSALARTAAFLDPDRLRADAALWRTGEMYVGP